MTIFKYPPGLHAKTNYFQTCKSVLTLEVEEFILKRMKASDNNIKPVMIVDDITKQITMKIPNDTLTALIDTPITSRDIVYKIQMKRKADWLLNRTMVQKSNLDIDEKEQAVKLIEEKDLKHKPLTTIKNKLYNNYKKRVGWK